MRAHFTCLILKLFFNTPPLFFPPHNFLLRNYIVINRLRIITVSQFLGLQGCNSKSF